MSRFYTTDKGDFIQDVIYKPDINLAFNTLLKKEQEVEQAKEITDSLLNINFNYLDSEQDKATAAITKEYYQSRADDLARRIQSDKLNAHKYIGEIKALQRDLQRDKTEGTISKLESSYNSFHNWVKQNEEICKVNPSLCNSLQAEARQIWGGDSTERTWGQERALKAIDQSKLVEDISKMKADVMKYAKATTDGMYIVDIGGETKKLSEERINNYIINKIMSDPANMDYMRQSDRLGLSEWFTKDGLPGRSFKQLVQAYDSYAYKETSSEHKMRENKYGLMDREEENRRKREQEAKHLNTFYTNLGVQSNTPEEVESKMKSIRELGKTNWNNMTPEQKTEFKNLSNYVYQQKGYDKMSDLDKAKMMFGSGSDYAGTVTGSRFRHAYLNLPEDVKRAYNHHKNNGNMDAAMLVLYNNVGGEKYFRNNFDSTFSHQLAIADDDYKLGFYDEGSTTHTYGNLVTDLLSNTRNSLLSSKKDLTLTSFTDKQGRELLLNGLGQATGAGGWAGAEVVLGNFTTFNVDGSGMRVKGDDINATNYWFKDNKSLESRLRQVNMKDLAEKYNLDVQAISQTDGSQIGYRTTVPVDILVKEKILDSNSKAAKQGGSIPINILSKSQSGPGVQAINERVNSTPYQTMIRDNNVEEQSTISLYNINVAKSGSPYLGKDFIMPNSNVLVKGNYKIITDPITGNEIYETKIGIPKTIISPVTGKPVYDRNPDGSFKYDYMDIIFEDHQSLMKSAVDGNFNTQNNQPLIGSDGKEVSI